MKTASGNTDNLGRGLETLLNFKRLHALLVNSQLGHLAHETLRASSHHSCRHSHLQF